MYSCTHCFKCIEACPKGVAPMSQIMRLRRRAGSDHHIRDRNNGFNHEHAFVKNIEKNGLLHENDLLADSFGGKLNPASGLFLMKSLPVITRALLRGKATLKVALLHPHKAPKDVKRIFETVEGREQRIEFNPYITGTDEDNTPNKPDAAPQVTAHAGQEATA
jgi:succinate dehydrogenase / fumarate reductase iron-sulfur subunit